MKALELQRQIRTKVKEKERQAELKREKNRLKLGKETTEARRIMEENQNKIYFEQLEITRKKDQSDREKLLEKLKAEKRARFGDVLDEEEDKDDPVNVRKKFKKVYTQMFKIYRYSDKESLNKCLKMLRKYMGNIVSNPLELKFQKINSENKTFVAKVKNIIGGTNLLTEAGFVLEDKYYHFKGTQAGLQEFLKAMEEEIHKMDMFLE